jgi:hypothetical protein
LKNLKDLLVYSTDRRNSDKKEIKMSSKDKRSCIINFVNGEPLRFTYEPVRLDEVTSLIQAIGEMSQTNNLIFNIEGKLIIIPMNNVRSIEISPSPVNLPWSVIKGKYLD